MSKETDAQSEIQALRAKIAEEEQKRGTRRKQRAEKTEGSGTGDGEEGAIARLVSPDLSTWGHRFVLQLFPWALLMGIYWFFGPLSLIQNTSRSDIGFDMLPALPWYLGAFVLLTLAGAALCALLRGKHFQRVLVAIFILGVLSYGQSLALNPDTGLLNGTAIDWSTYTRDMVWGTVIWVLVAGAVAVGCFALKRNKYKLIVGVSALLLLMQCAGFAADIGSVIEERKDTRFVFSAEDQLVVSEDQNVILIVLDSFSNLVTAEVEEEYPDAFDFLHDFTSYTNYAPCYYATFPEMVHVLTGADYETDMTWREYQTGAWKSERARLFFSTLQEKGYTRRFLTTEGLMAPSKEYLEDTVDNLEDVQYRMVVSETFRQVGKLTLFRYAPTVMKPLFFVTPTDFLKVGEGTRDASGRVRDARIVEETELDMTKWTGLGSAFYDTICEQPLDTMEGNLFLYAHFLGAHPPYVLDEDLNMCEEGMDVVPQSRGFLWLVEQYLERLKELGVYEDATIMLMADHGDQNYGLIPGSVGALMYVKLPGEQHDRSPVNDIAVTDDSILPTLMQGVDPEIAARLGTPLSDVKEGDNPVRTIREMEFPGRNEAMFNVYRFSGHVNDLHMLEPDEQEILPDRFW